MKQTNLEHYTKEIAEYISMTNCNTIDCGECIFARICDKYNNDINEEEYGQKLYEWFLQKYQEEPSEPIKITMFEKMFLEMVLEQGFIYIARDRNGGLGISTNKLTRYPNNWVHDSMTMHGISIFNNKFQFIKWIDKEPYYIPKLLEECEVVD